MPLSVDSFEPDVKEFDGTYAQENTKLKRITHPKGLSIINESHEEKTYRDSLAPNEDAEQRDFVNTMSKIVSGTGDNVYPYPFSKQLLSNIKEENSEGERMPRNDMANFSFHDSPGLLKGTVSNSFSCEFKPARIQQDSQSLLGIEPRMVSESLASPVPFSKGNSIIVTDRKYSLVTEVWRRQRRTRFRVSDQADRHDPRFRQHAFDLEDQQRNRYPEERAQRRTGRAVF